jgi:pimeloyl-ACP methyl ester carboxylesterase
MARIKANGIVLEYDTIGDPARPAFIMITGLSGQMILWDEDLCTTLADRGLYVIRFDNRDTGLSSKIENPGDPHPDTLLAALGLGEKIAVPYSLEDMAADAIGLMDGLGIEKAHVCGASMGGMIAQIMAIDYPERVLSLTSISSSTGNADIHQNIVKKDKIPLRIPVPVPRERKAYIDYMVSGMKELSGPGFPFNEEEVTELAGELYDRSFYPEGTTRQLLAILTAGNRKLALSKINIPTLVIHGNSDPLVPVEYGHDTAETIPGAELLIIKGMGHDLPKDVWPRVIEAISRKILRQAK